MIFLKNVLVASLLILLIVEMHRVLSCPMHMSLPSYPNHFCHIKA